MEFTWTCWTPVFVHLLSNVEYHMIVSIISVIWYSKLCIKCVIQNTILLSIVELYSVDQRQIHIQRFEYYSFDEVQYWTRAYPREVPKLYNMTTKKAKQIKLGGVPWRSCKHVNISVASLSYYLKEGNEFPNYIRSPLVPLGISIKNDEHMK